MSKYITTTLTIDMSTGEVLRQEGYWYEGPVELMKGASADEKSLATSQQNFANTLTQDYSTQFGNQAAILGSLKSALAPVINAGPGQYGYTNAEDAAMRTQASAGTSAIYRNAKQAEGEAAAAAGGGNVFLPSGVKTQEQGKLATDAAQQEAAQQLAITTGGFNQGRTNFNNAVSEESGVASEYNPLGYAGAGTGATNTAFNSASTVNSQNIAGSPWSIAGGILGGAIGTAESAFGVPKSAQPVGASQWTPQASQVNTPLPAGAPGIDF